MTARERLAEILRPSSRRRFEALAASHAETLARFADAVMTADRESETGYDFCRTVGEALATLESELSDG